MNGGPRKAALVTGAASGIGRQTAIRLAERGYRLLLIDCNEAGLVETSERLRKAGGQSDIAVADVRDAAAVASAVDRLAKAAGGIDILVNNAGDAHLASILDVTHEQFRETVDVNLMGVFYCTKSSIPHMMGRPGASIINISSWLGRSGRPKLAAYCSSKFAVVGFTESVAHDLAPHGIRVNAVCPGAIGETRLREIADKENRDAGLPTAEERKHTIPFGRLGTPDDIALVICMLASEETAYVTGQAVSVTGGLWMN